MKTLKTVLLFILLTAVFPAIGQQPVRWRSFVETKADGTGMLTIKALIEPGWHLYGLELPAGGPKATTFDFSESKGIKFTGALKPKREALTVKDEMFGMDLNWWDSNIEFTIPFKITGGEPTYNCKVSYMTCDGNTCMPPTTQSLTGKIKTDSK